MEHYFFYTILGTGISWALYFFLLRKEKSFVFNRFYLLGSLVLCLLAPLLEIDAGKAAAHLPELDISEIAVSPALEANELFKNSSPSTLEQEQSFLPTILFSAYILITLASLVRFFINLQKILQKISGSEGIRIEGLRIIPVVEKGNSYSFFHFLFFNEKDLENKNISEAVIQHESAHSRQFHSVDVLLIELLSCFFWINPFIWLYRKAIIRNHEFLADAAVVKAGIDVKIYSHELICAGDKNQYFQLISGFNFNQTKKRLVMLHSNKSSRKVTSLKILSAMTLFSIMFMFSSFTTGAGIETLEINEGLKVIESDTPDPIELSSEDSIKAVQTPGEELLPGTQNRSIPYAVVEQVPLFPGCETEQAGDRRRECTSEKVMSFVQDNIDPKAVQLYTMPQGNNVFIQFRINEEGNITNARARATTPHLDTEEKAVLEEEAIRAVNAIPQMTPAKHDGEIVGVLYAVRL